MKKTILLFLVILINSFSSVYSQNWKWSKAAGGDQKIESYAIAIDSAGNSYITGWFEDSLHFGTTTLVTSIAGNSFASDIFIAKYDKNGNFIWAKKAGGTNYDYANGIATDKNGNIYLTGLFIGTATFGTLSITSTTNDYDVFIAKYDSNGNALWVQKGGGNVWDVGSGIAVDNQNNCYIVGAYRNTATFGTTTFTSAGSYDIFVAKYDTNGSFLWAKSAGGTGDDRGHGICVDHIGNCYITGYFKSTMTVSTNTLTPIGDADIFLAKYNSAGVAQWGKGFGGLLADEGLSVKVSNSGNLYVTGYYTDAATFDTTVVNGYGNADAFVGKYDYKGDLIWIKKYGGTQNDKGYGISLDTFNNVYVTGSFWGTGNFDTITTASFNQDDIFVAGINDNAETKWVLKGGGLNMDVGRGIAASPYGYCYVTGYFSSDAYFGDLTISGPMPENDLFVAKIDSTFIYDGIPLVDTIPTDTVPNSIAINSMSKNELKVLVYPNPFQTSATIAIEHTTTKQTIEIFDIIGNNVTSNFSITEKSSNNNNALLEIKEKEAKAGIYFLKVKNETSEKISRLVLMK
ncbi:MAG: SBBP repeat-containing protein [Bacteroidia bacterium]